ncbi:cytochrome o ubiquinol oxidase subunit IV [Pseudomonas monteilii]|jgi:cytochrome o ubiquinol oxidase operon protein cyoD|uniref:cytochrome o ubiquinol oxidase subunit IV n=1 Tax=Pseudomonas alabamensis TaxID=3064349 RepID=UPI000745D275|nr:MULTISPECIES: cytochrome o ubiquinol oxidase subunit IV [Pseudomonas]AMA44817.1 cytochrome o ubiquinol oxidase subunit IV [Pseudomonas monteilii]MDO7910335.1 cytochrome o ubiquinol oxidase subunit IV [Pseudomonas sp. 22-AL-CL-001]
MANAHDTHHEGNHGSVKSYVIGFVLSVILTAIPFGLAMYPSLPKNLTVLVIVALAVIQVVVHLFYFLHMDRSKEQRNNLTTFLFTTMVIALLVGLSLWIMFSIHVEMMAK